MISKHIKIMTAVIAVIAIVGVGGVAALEGDGQGERANERQREWGDRGDGKGMRDGEQEGFDGSKQGRSSRWDKPLTDERVLEAIDVLQAIDPGVAKRLQAQFDEDPDRARKHIRREMPRLQRFLEFKAADPEMFSLKCKEMGTVRQLGQLRKQYREAKDGGDDAAMAATSAEIKELLAQRFDVRIQSRQLELIRLRERLADIEAELDEETSDRDAIIAKQLDDFLEERPEPRRSPGPPEGRPAGPPRGDRDAQGL